MTNRRQFIGILIAGTAGTMLAPSLSLPAFADAPNTIKVRLKFADKQVYEFSDVPVIYDGKNWTCPDLVMEAQSDCVLTEVSSVWHPEIFGLTGDEKEVTHAIYDVFILAGNTLTVVFPPNMITLH